MPSLWAFVQSTPESPGRHLHWPHSQIVVLIAVQDSGPGLAPATLVFDAFYTTKPGGLGLGLSIYRSIIETHGGSIAGTGQLRLAARFLSSAFPPTQALPINQSSLAPHNPCAAIGIHQRLVAQTSSSKSGLVGWAALSERMFSQPPARDQKQSSGRVTVSVLNLL
jgi:Histidine kinase-, DNA gyrase B-, and HSP90-like ATPase